MMVVACALSMFSPLHAKKRMIIGYPGTDRKYLAM